MVLIMTRYIADNRNVIRPVILRFSRAIGGTWGLFGRALMASVLSTNVNHFQITHRARFLMFDTARVVGGSGGGGEGGNRGGLGKIMVAADRNMLCP